MASVKIPANDRHRLSQINFSTTTGLVIYCALCKSTVYFSISSHNDRSNMEVDNQINQFQASQWIKYGQRMPKNWVDPFEIYD